MTDRVDRILELIDGALADTGVDAMRWRPAPPEELAPLEVVLDQEALVAILDGDYPHGPLTVHPLLGYPAVTPPPGVQIDWAPIIEALRPAVDVCAQLLEQLADVFNRCRADIERLLELVHVIDTPVTEVDVQRLRHGHAAVCPRHGPTKGGLCRRCRR